jgi:hypothetical protein
MVDASSLSHTTETTRKSSGHHEEQRMHLTLSEHEADLLRGLLEDHLPDLQREAARTEQHDMRHLLIERQDLVQRLLKLLPPSAR